MNKVMGRQYKGIFLETMIFNLGGHQVTLEAHLHPIKLPIKYFVVTMVIITIHLLQEHLTLHPYSNDQIKDTFTLFEGPAVSKPLNYQTSML